MMEITWRICMDGVDYGIGAGVEAGLAAFESRSIVLAAKPAGTARADKMSETHICSFVFE